MALRIAYDAGHGLNTGGKRCLKSLDPKETREWSLNSRIAEYVESGLKIYKDVVFLRVDDRTGKNDISLVTRVRAINSFNPTVVISTHHNAGIGGGTGGGITVHRAPGSSVASAKYQKVVYEVLIKHTGLKGNRSNPMPLDAFYIIRNVKAPAILIEHGFMDSRTDVPIILSDTFARQCANAHIEFLVNEFRLVKKTGAQAPTPTLPSGQTYPSRGSTGAEVKKVQQMLKDLGYSIAVDGSFGPASVTVLKEFQAKHKLTVDGSAGPDTQSKMIALLDEKKVSVPTQYFRVRLSWANTASQKGAFEQLELAIEEAKKHKGDYKVYNHKGAIVYPAVIQAPVVPPSEKKIPITGKSLASYKQMSKMLTDNNKKPGIAISADELAKLFIEEGAKEGIRGDIAFCQAMKETGWLRYGGQVLPEQNNYCGLGATNNSPTGKGAWFKTEREGVRAQIQHLKAYANKESLVEKCVDPRFNLVTRGVAPNWSDLNGRWAVPGTRYGQEILEIFNLLLKVVVEAEENSIGDDAELISTLREEISKLRSELEGKRRVIDNIKGILEK